MKKIIIDADPGTDDFIAISLALKSRKFDVLGITTVEGNCSLENATKNTFKVLNMCERDDIEVYKGLKNDYLGTPNATDAHGNNGLGGIEYRHINRKENKMGAVDFLINTVKENPGEITLVAIGPLTNIAECIKKDSYFARNVKELIIMGGSASYGNITPYAEFNFYKDPNSVDTVLKADFKSIKIFGWDVTTKAPLLKEYEEKLKESNLELPRFIYDITRSTANRDTPLYGGAVISDALVIAYLLDSTVCKLDYASVKIILEGEKQGSTQINFVDNSNIMVATSIDSDKFYKILFSEIYK